jgi:hypothetical protein
MVRARNPVRGAEMPDQAENAIHESSTEGMHMPQSDIPHADWMVRILALAHLLFGKPVPTAREDALVSGVHAGGDRAVSLRPTCNPDHPAG